MTIEQTLTLIALVMWIKGILVGLLLEYYFEPLKRLISKTRKCDENDYI